MGIKRYHFLSQLPSPYQEIFRTGQVPSSSSLQVYHPHTQRVLLGIISVLTFPIFIGLLIFFLYGMGQLFFEHDDSRSASYTFITAFGTLLLLFILAWAFGLYSTLYRDFAIVKHKTLNRFHFGLLLDGHCLVWRRKVPFLPIIQIQKSDIESIETIMKGGQSFRSPKIQYFRVSLQDSGKKQFIDIPGNAYNFSGMKLDEVLNAWRLA